MKRIWSGFALVCLQLACLFSVSMADQSGLDKEYYLGLLSENLPDEWEIIEVVSGRVPLGHYWAKSYKGLTGFRVKAMGPKDVYMHIWNDSGKLVMKEAVAKEAVYIWVMPTNYYKNWRGFFSMKDPNSARLAFKGQKVKVYYYPADEIVDKERYEKLIWVGIYGFRGWPFNSEEFDALWEKRLQDIFMGE